MKLINEDNEINLTDSITLVAIKGREVNIDIGPGDNFELNPEFDINNLSGD